jgi:2-polyprenyl-3-methyl-5-hydroxy-6-metoxy-1,4-benzoquinol methylase
MTETERLTTEEYWTAEAPGFFFGRYDGHAVEKIIKKYIPATNGGNCIEIGSFPGPFLTVFGDMGYTLNGIDFHPKNERDLPAWLLSQGYKIDEFKTVDFFNHATTKKFDVVASFGFIEHFENYDEVILKHAELVSDDGYVIITTPNFRGSIQCWLHKTFDNENLLLHNLESMQPQKWAALLRNNGFEIIYQGFFGGFLFWRANEKMGKVKEKVFWFVVRIIPRLRKIIWFESPAFSGFCGVVAKRIKK